MRNRILLLLSLGLFTAFVSEAGTVRQWIPAGSGSWNTPANWSGGAVPVAGDTADFSAVNITGDATITLDANQAVANIIFGDTTPGSAGSWIIVPGSLATATLTLDTTALITVNTLGTGKSARIEVVLAGTAGLNKDGPGILDISETPTLTGATNVNAGTLRMGRPTAPATPVAGSSLWLDASDGATITQAAGTVSQWRDKSGNNRHANQATAANQPTFRANAQNGRSVIRFDGTDDFMTTDLTFLIGAQYTIFAVEGRTSNKASSYMLGTETGSTNNGLHFGWRNNNNFTQAHFGNDLNYTNTALAFTTQVFRNWTGRFNAAEKRIYLNEVSVASAAQTAALASALNGTVGRGHGQTNYFQGDIAEILIYNSALSDLDRRNVSRYLSSRWTGTTEPAVYTTGSAVTVAAGATFDLNGQNQTIASLAGAGNVVLGAGNLTFGSNNTSTVFSGAISGTGSITKTGTGTLTLSGSSSYTGTTTINGGNVIVTSNQALGTADNGTTITGGLTLTFSNVNYAAAEVLTMNAGNNNGSSRFESVGGANTFAGSIVLGCSAPLIIQDGGLTLGGGISGPHGIIKQGTGTLTLQGTSSYTGDTAIHNGVVRLAGPNRLPTTTTVILGTESTGGQLDLNNQNQQLAGLLDVRSTNSSPVAPAAPDTLTGLLYWLDANDAATLFQDAAGTTPVTAPGQPVGMWRDKSGNNRHFVQATAAAQPAFAANAIGASSAVRFDGLDDQISLATATTPVTLFIVNRMAPAAQNLAGIWGSSNPGDKGLRREDLRAVWRTSDANDFAMPQRNVYINGGRTSDFVSLNTPHVVSVVRGAAFANVAPTLNNTHLGLYVAGRAFAGDIAEVVVYDRALSDAERRSVETFLNDKWNVPTVSAVVDSTNDATIPDLNVNVAASIVNTFTGQLGLPNRAAFSFTKSGPGVFELANAASHTGGTIVQEGVLRLADSSAATALPVTTGLQQQFDASDASTFTPAIAPVSPVAPNLLPGGGLAVWLDASVPATITESGGKVSQWDDISGNGFHFSQAAGASQPNYVPGDTRIDGSNTLFLTHSASQILLGATGATVFVVGRNQPTATAGGWGDFSADGNDNLTPNRDDGKLYDGFASAARQDLGFVGYNPNARFLYGVTQDGTGISAYYNSAYVRRVATAFTVPTIAQQRIFAQRSAFSMHEVIIFNRALSDAERKRIEQYLSNKWGIAEAAPGATISTWASTTGAAANKDLTQATAANQPTLLPASSDFAGKPVVLFDGNDVLSNTQDFSANSSTVIAVQRLTRSFNARLVTSRVNNWLMGYHGGFEDRFHPTSWVSPNANQSTPTGVAKIYSAVNDAGTNMFWNGMTYMAGNRNGTAGPNGLSIGAYLNNPTNEASRGEVGEILVYDRRLTTIELRAVVEYLRAKWLSPLPSTRGSLNDAGNVVVSSGATFDLNSFDETVGPLTVAAGGSVTLGSATLTVNSTAASTVAGVISGTGNLVKDGPDVLTLTNSNVYTGATTVNAGTLNLANPGGSATGTTPVTVNAAGTLSGTGSTLSAVNIVGGTLSAGNGGPGTLTLGALSMDAASTLNADLGTNSDLVIVNGPLTLDGTVNTNPIGGFAFGRFTLMVYGGALTDSILDVGTVPPGYTPTVEAGSNLVVLALAAPTTTTLVANPVSPTIFSQPLTFTATVAPVAPAIGTPVGSVIFKVDGVAQPPALLVNGVATLNLASLPVGAHTIEANYSVSSTSGASSDSLPHTVVLAQSALALSSSANPSPDGSAEISAVLSGVAPAVGTPTGSVTFKVNGTTTTVNSTNGVATLPLSGLVGGVYPVEATYGGDAGFAGSTATMNQTVTPKFTSPPTITPNPAVAGQPIVASVDAGPNGTVTWNWGDGSSFTGANATHLYTSPGLYTLTVTVTLSDGTSLSATQSVFVSSGLGDGAGGGGGATPPGVTGVLIGGNGVTLKQGAKGKLSVDYVAPARSNFAATAPMGALSVPDLTLADVAFVTGTLSVGPTGNSVDVTFFTDAKGRVKSASIKSALFNLKKKTFSFKLQDDGLTDAIEAIGGTKADSKTKKTSTIYVPVRIQIGSKVFLALAYQMTYTATTTKGKGSLAK